MTTEVIIKALEQELKGYSSLHVRYLVYDPLAHCGHSLRIKRVGCKDPMIVTLFDGRLRCRVLVNHGTHMTQERGGTIELAAPDAIEQLLSILKRDLR